MDSYECVEHLDAASKNEKLQKNMMCSVGSCVKIFGGEAHLKHHYKKAHPEAIFEIDFMDNDKIVNEQERTKNFIKDKKVWMKEDVEIAKQKFVKKNTQFRVMSDNYKEHAEYDAIFKK